MTRSEILAAMSTQGLHDERTACLLLTTDRYAGSDSVKEWHADYADRISDELDRRSDLAEQRRLLNSWNAVRHGWDRFQDGTRRTALRLARKSADEPDTDSPV